MGWSAMQGRFRRQRLGLGVTEAREGEGTFTGIQALRAVAALVVVYGHSVNLLQRHHAVVAMGLDRLQGATGVDLFFVISGFVITISADGLLRKRHPVRVFLWRRVLRVAPLYWILTTARLLALAWWPAIGAHQRPSIWNAVSSFLFLPSLNPAGEVRPVIPVGWTLNFEAFFYVAFALALLRRREFPRILIPLICVLGVVGLVRTPAWPVWTAQVDPILLEFVAGVGIALLAKRRGLPGGAAARVLVAAGGLGLALTPSALASSATRPLVWGVPAAAVVLGCVALEPSLKRQLPRWLLLLGSASYSIYLVQTFALPVLGAVFDSVEGVVMRATPLREAVEVVLGLGVTTLAGVAVHLLVERPVTDFLKRRFGRERIAPIARSA